MAYCPGTPGWSYTEQMRTHPDGFSTLAIAAQPIMARLPPERHRHGWSSRSSSEPPPAESQLETKIKFLWLVSPFFSWASAEKDLSVHCNPFPGREDIPSHTACQPSVSPRDRGTMWMLTRRAPPRPSTPTNRFHLTLFLRIDIALPTSNSLRALWISITLCEVSQTVCLSKNSGFDSS